MIEIKIVLTVIFVSLCSFGAGIIFFAVGFSMKMGQGKGFYKDRFNKWHPFNPFRKEDK